MDTGILSLAIIGNICNFAYNVPFVWVVVKHRNANNISGKFLYLRVFTSIVWILYSIFTQEIFVGCSYTVTLISSCIVLYIKLTQKEIKENPKNEIFLIESQV